MVRGGGAKDTFLAFSSFRRKPALLGAGVLAPRREDAWRASINQGYFAGYYACPEGQAFYFVCPVLAFLLKPWRGKRLQENPVLNQATK